jgi:hypothetical protein
MNYNTLREDYPPQSVYTDPADLERFGWVHELFETDGTKVLETLGPALEALKLSSNLADYKIGYDVHGKDYKDDKHKTVKVYIAKIIILGLDRNFIINFALKQECC